MRDEPTKYRIDETGALLEFNESHTNRIGFTIWYPLPKYHEISYIILCSEGLFCSDVDSMMQIG